jgi:ParB family transcriptional regulator, chromosome partitioning protein
MTAATEKVDQGAVKAGSTKATEEKGARPSTPVPEKRRALGRGLESLLPGPRVVAGTGPRPGVSSQPSPEPTRGAGPEVGAVSPMAGLERPVVRNAEIAGARPVDETVSQVSGNEGRSDRGQQSGESTQALGSGEATREADGGVRSTPDGTPQSAASTQALGSGEATGKADEGVRSTPGSSTPGSSTPGRSTPGGTAGHPTSVGDIQAVRASDNKSSDSFEGVEVRELPLELIDKNPYQTRHFTEEDDRDLIELGKSIQAQGLIQPITVREGKDGRFTLIAGDRRTRAAKWAGLKTIAAIVWEVSEQEAAEITIIENLMREDLNCMDQTRAFVLLSSKFHMTQADIAERVGMSRESVSNYMRLSRLPSKVQDYLINGELEFSHARQLLKLEDDAMVLKLAEKVVKERILVWELEEMMLGGVPAAFKAPDEEKVKRGARWVDPNVKAAQRDLERVLGMRVRIRDRNNKGRIQIEYSNLEDFDRVVGMLKGSS